MCATCYRLFASPRSIQQHIESTHKISDPLSIWNRPLKVLYEDKHLAVVDKPQGMAVMGDSPSLCKSDLLLALAGYGNDALNKPVPAHRLDAPTGGLLVVAKTKACESKLKCSFADRSCRKRYVALSLGRIEPPQGTIDVPIGGKPAVTHYRVLHCTRSADEMANGWVTTVELHPVTGRKHQLRRHLKHLGHPIWGDRRHAPYRKTSGESAMNQLDLIHSTSVEQNSHIRLCLWAVEISFPHPETGVELNVALDGQPEWLTSLLEYQERRVIQDKRELN
jgi:RluA family pseudouridine synthase